MARPNSEDRPSTINRSDRPKRVPINGLRDILAVQGKEPGWHYCWQPEHFVDRFLNAGYEYVTHEVVVGDRKLNTGSQIGSKVTLSVGNGVIGYLLRCPDETYQEERRYGWEQADKQEAAMRSSANEEGRYGQVKIGKDLS